LYEADSIQIKIMRSEDCANSEFDVGRRKLIYISKYSRFFYFLVKYFVEFFASDTYHAIIISR